MSEQSYICVFLTKLYVEDNSEDEPAGVGEVVLLTNCATADPDTGDATLQRLRFPETNWYETPDWHDWIGFPHPNIGPKIVGTENPWAIPVFSLPEDKMESDLLISLAMLEDDSSSAAQGIHKIVAAVGPQVARAIVGYYAGPAAGEAAGKADEAIHASIAGVWDDDTVMIHTNILKRGDDWGIGAPRADIN